MTIHYEVQVDFATLPSYCILQSKSKDKAIGQMVKIRDFLGIPVGKVDLKYIDESTSRYKN